MVFGGWCLMMFDGVWWCLSPAYGKVFLVRKTSGHDEGQLYAMKVRRSFILTPSTTG